MASSINFNTVWTSIFEPLPTFGFLDRLAKEGPGAPATRSTTTWSAPTPPGVVLRTGSAVRNWKTGDKVTVHCNYVDDQDPSAHDDSMLAANQRIWGFETNFGGLADLAVVKANQLMPKPTHLSWEEAADQRAVQLHRLPHARLAQRRRDDPGRQGPRLGCERRSRQLRRPARPQRRRHAGRRGLVAREGQAAQRPGRRGGHRPQGGRLPVLGRRAHAGRVRMAPLRQGHPLPGRRRPRHRLRASRAARPWAPRSSPASGPARSSPARPRRAT